MQICKDVIANMYGLDKLDKGTLAIINTFNKELEIAKEILKPNENTYKKYTRFGYTIDGQIAKLTTLQCTLKQIPVKPMKKYNYRDNAFDLWIRAYTKQWNEYCDISSEREQELYEKKTGLKFDNYNDFMIYWYEHEIEGGQNND